MKKKHFALIFTAVILLASCTQLRQMANLRKCQFRIASLTNTRLANVDVNRIRSFEDLNLLDATKIAAAFFAGNVPLTFNLNLQAKNPNTETAALNRFDWIAMIDDTEILEGTSTQRIEVKPNNGMTDIPLSISVNLTKILSKFTKKQVVDFGTGLADSQNKPTRVALRLKPSIMIGQRSVAYPGYFTVKREFTAGR